MKHLHLYKNIKLKALKERYREYKGLYKNSLIYLFRNPYLGFKAL
jgi:hypothetical protein